MARRKAIVCILLLATVFASVAVVQGGKADSSETHYLPIVFSYSPPAYISEIYPTGTFAGNLRITGEVMVVTSTPIYSITVEIRAYDSFNQLVSTKSGNTAFAATFPGQPNPFDIVLPVQSSQVAYFTAFVKDWSITHNKNIQPAAVVDLNVIVGAEDAIVITTIQNNNSDPLTNVNGLAWSLKSGGNTTIPITNYLAPGATTIFTITLMGEGGPPGTMPNVHAAAQGEVIP